MQAFICIIEKYNGSKMPARTFAESKEEARKRLIEQFPKCYVSEALTMKEYEVTKKCIDNSKYIDYTIDIDKLTSDYLWSKIKAYCKYNHIQRTELAQTLDVTPATVSNYGQSADNLKLSSIYNFCKQYGINGLSELERF